MIFSLLIDLQLFILESSLFILAYVISVILAYDHVILANAGLLLHVLACRELQKLHFTRAVRCHGSRSHCAQNVPRTLHVRPPHAPTARSIVYEV